MATEFVSGETLPVELQLESPAARSPALRRRSNEVGLQIFDYFDGYNVERQQTSFN